MNYEILSLKTAKKIKQQEIEIDRLNDILDEFEKLLEEERTRTKYVHDVERFTAYDYTIKRLQKLRSGDCE